MSEREKVEVVTIDMWRPYRDAAKDVLPAAKIIVDKFHVLKMANEATESVRRSIGKKQLDKIRRKLMNDRYVVLKRTGDLNDFDKLSLDMWSKEFPLLGQAHRLKESFYEIYEASDRFEAMERYWTWLMSVPKELEPAFGKLLRALKNWKEQIFAYFDVNPHVTNAYTESVNSLIRHVNRGGRGYSFNTLRAKLLYVGKTREYREAPYQKSDWKNDGVSEAYTGALYKIAPEYIDMGVDIATLIELYESGEL